MTTKRRLVLEQDSDNSLVVIRLNYHLYANTLEKRLHNTREGYGLTAQTRRCSNTPAMLASVFTYGKEEADMER